MGNVHVIGHSGAANGWGELSSLLFKAGHNMHYNGYSRVEHAPKQRDLWIKDSFPTPDVVVLVDPMGMPTSQWGKGWGVTDPDAVIRGLSAEVTTIGKKLIIFGDVPAATKEGLSGNVTIFPDPNPADERMAHAINDALKVRVGVVKEPPQ